MAEEKVTIQFDLRLFVSQFTMQVDKDKAFELVAKFKQSNNQLLEFLPLDLSSEWRTIINAALDTNIEIEDLDILVQDKEPA